MKRTRILRVKDFAERIHSVYSDAIAFKQTHKYMLERMKTLVWEHEHYKRLTQYDRGYLRGIEDTLFRAIYSHMYFAYAIDGRVMTWSQWRAANPGDIDMSIWGSNGRAVGNHYWNGTEISF